MKFLGFSGSCPWSVENVFWNCASIFVGDGSLPFVADASDVSEVARVPALWKAFFSPEPARALA